MQQFLIVKCGSVSWWVLRVMTIRYSSSPVECLPPWPCFASRENLVFSRHSAACRLLLWGVFTVLSTLTISRHLLSHLYGDPPCQWPRPSWWHPSGCCSWSCSSRPSLSDRVRWVSCSYPLCSWLGPASGISSWSSSLPLCWELSSDSPGMKTTSAEVWELISFCRINQSSSSALLSGSKTQARTHSLSHKLLLRRVLSQIVSE